MRIHSAARLAAVLAVVFVACKPSPGPGRSAARGPQVRATVVTLRTTIQPGNRVHRSTVVIANGVARSSAEHDVWRLYDTEGARVTVVDDVDRTFRTEPVSAFSARRRRAAANAPAPYIPRAAVERPGERRTILGVRAERVSVVVGSYRRDLWIGRHRGVPDSLFSMMAVSEPATSPLSAMMRRADEALAAVRGFPLVDHAEVTLEGSKIVIDRTVVSIAEREVPAALVQVPQGYRDLAAEQKRATGQ